MPTNYTPEERDRWIKRMAEIEGLTYITQHEKGYKVGACWWAYKDKPDIPVSADYPSDLNALARVTTIMCKTVEGRNALNTELDLAWKLVEEKSIPRTTKVVWRTFLLPKELFPIIGRAIDIIDKETK